MLIRSVSLIVCKGINFMQIRQLFLGVILLNGQLVIAQQNDCHVHTVQPGEGIYSVSRLYATKPAHIMAANPEIGKEMQIKVGQKLCIPKNASVIPTEQIIEANKVLHEEQNNTNTKTINPLNPVKEGSLWIHTVQKNETFYGICKLYQVLAYDMIATNNLPNTLVMENQKLILPINAMIPNQPTKTQQAPVEVSPLVEMTKNAAAEAKTEAEKPIASKEKKDATEKKNNKSDTKKKDEKASPKTEQQATDLNKNSAKTEPSVAKTHTVQKGDTYFNLTKKYNLEYVDIKQLNNLSSTDLKLGQTIIVSKPQSVVKEDEEDGIPANAHIIDLSKEVAKMEDAKPIEASSIASKNTKKKTTSTNKEKASKNKEEKLTAIEKEDIAKDEPKNIVVEEKVEAPQPVAIQPEPFVETKPQEANAANAIIEEKPLEPESVDIVVNEIPKTEPILEAKPVLSFSEEYGNNYNSFASNNNYKLQKFRGTAGYTESITGNEYLVYYNGAEPGSIIKITNLMSKQSAFAKVINSVSSADNADNASLKVSKKLAQQLQVLDDVFLVEVSRYAKN